MYFHYFKLFKSMPEFNSDDEEDQDEEQLDGVFIKCVKCSLDFGEHSKKSSAERKLCATCNSQQLLESQKMFMANSAENNVRIYI